MARDPRRARRDPMQTLRSGRALRQVPNALTITRLFLAGVFPLGPASWRPALLLAALATEYLDGALSRLLGAETRLGRLLDPIADKLFFAAVALTLLAEGRLGVAELALLALRDVGVLAALAWWTARRDWHRIRDLRPALAGKATTTLQYVALFVLVFRAEVPAALVALTAATGALAVAQYSVRLRRPAVEHPAT
jgi:phosphatidylglycerophosphate synthase